MREAAIVPANPATNIPVATRCSLPGKLFRSACDFLDEFELIKEVLIEATSRPPMCLSYNCIVNVLLLPNDCLSPISKKDQ